MASRLQKASKPEIELHPDGGQRFERAMAVVKSPPQHRVKKRLTAAMKRRALKPAKPRAKKA